MLKHLHRDFPSDLFVVLETVGASISIRLFMICSLRLLFIWKQFFSYFSTVDCKGVLTEKSLPEFLDVDMQNCIVFSVTLPPLSKNHFVKTFKIMPRYANTYGYLIAGFCAQISYADMATIVDKPRIVYGGVSPDFVRLLDCNLVSNSVCE